MKFSCKGSKVQPGTVIELQHEVVHLINAKLGIRVLEASTSIEVKEE